MKFKSLKTRILIWFGSVMSALLILFSIGFYYFYNQSLNTSLQSKLYKEALLIEHQIESNIPIETILSNISLIHLQFAILEDGKVLNQTSSFRLQNIKAYTKQYTSFSTIDNGEYTSAILTLKFKKPFNGTIILIENNIDDKVKSVVDTMLILNPMLLFLMILFASKLIDKILIPVKEITRIAKKINKSRLTIQIKETKYKHDDELKELIDSFNDMIIRLQNEFERVERFNSDVSHELKTPLTVIKGEISLMLRRLREPSEYQQALKIISYEANSMQEMVDNLLLFVQYSKENIKESFSSIDMDTILLMVLEKYSLILKEKNIKVQMERFEPIQYIANSQLITTIFSNIVDNAIKYTLNDKSIYISLFKKNNQIYFIVQDEGIGIAQNKIARITNRFYRVDESRNKEIKGIGLGLSIVKNSVELHGAKLNISSQINIGTTVIITF